MGQPLSSSRTAPCRSTSCRGGEDGGGLDVVPGALERVHPPLLDELEDSQSGSGLEICRSHVHL